MASQIRHIVSGPGLFALSVRLFEGSSAEQRPVQFGVCEWENGRPTSSVWHEDILLLSAEREDGSGKRWNLAGFNMSNHAKVSIFYDLDKQGGTMTFNP